MKAPLFRRPKSLSTPRQAERGVTMVLVALCMLTIIGMAALSIDVVTLYLAREEAQRAADAAALAGARIISLSGITTTADPANSPADWKSICGGTASVASVAAQAAGQQNAVATSTPTVSITYSAQGAPAGNADCSTLPTAFAINPTVIATVKNSNLPTLFSRIWSRNVNSVSATAAAEVINPSNSGSIAAGGDAIQVVPRCVKPWIIPNLDPGNGGSFVDKNTGAIVHKRIRINGAGTGGIGEPITLQADCKTGAADCNPANGHMLNNPPLAGSYVPALVTVNPVAFPVCADDDLFQEAIGGCDESTAYQCGIPIGSNADLTFNPGGSGGDTAVAGQCLINQKANGLAQGQDALDVTAYPYKMLSGSQNPILPSANTQLITASNSVVSLPIYDQTAGNLTTTQPTITILGYLQVFIDSVDSTTGNVNLHVLNVAGCGNDASTTVLAPGTSPLPIRLITTQ
jgi:Flp pilus assembly protein TadG